MKKLLAALLTLCIIMTGQPCRAHAAEWDGEGALSTEAAEPAEERDMEAEEGGFFCESGIGLFSMEGIAGSGVCAAADLFLYGVLLWRAVAIL